jgi:hypothetical protein
MESRKGWNIPVNTICDCVWMVAMLHWLNSLGGATVELNKRPYICCQAFTDRIRRISEQAFSQFYAG